jgi:hypothetical protein
VSVVKHQSKRPRPSWEDFEVASYQPGQTLPPHWSPSAYAKWLFEFLRCDLGTLTPGQLLGMRADLSAFVRPEIVTGTSWADDSLLPTRDVLETLRQDARAGIQRVRNGEWFELEEGICYGICRIGDGVFRGQRRGSFADLFRAAVMEVVQSQWSRLRDCPRCHETFLKMGKQKFCSTTCASKASWDAFKTRRRARDSHQEHASRTRKRLGRNVKVSTKHRRRT